MAEVRGGGFVHLPGEARTIDVGGFRVDVLADAADTDASFTLIATAETEVGSGPPLHVHRDAAESFFVLAGHYVMHLDGRDVACPAGSFIYVPRGMPHTFRTDAIGSRKLNLYTPAAMVGYFDELGAALRDGVDEATLDGIAERHGMEILGPVPEGYL